MRLLFIHGRAQGGQDPDELRGRWKRALDKGLAQAGLTLPDDVKIDFPYYGDTLDQIVKQFDLPLSPGIAAKGGADDAEYAQFRSDIADEIAGREGIPQTAILDEFGGEVAEKGPQNWRWVHAVIRFLDKRRHPAVALTVERFLRDVYLYTHREAVQNRIDAIVEHELTGEPTVVVGHSLGSVVAYNILKKAGRDAEIIRLVTIGSPLGIQAIKSRLGTLGNPSPQRGWFNGLDTRDVVALYPLDANNFAVDPSITNHSEVNNWTDNRHGIAGYLDDPKIARAIATSFN